MQIDFTEEAIKELDELQELVRLPSKVETIRYALRFLRWAVDETTKEGGELCVAKNGLIREMIPFWKTQGGLYGLND